MRPTTLVFLSLVLLAGTFSAQSQSLSPKPLRSDTTIYEDGPGTLAENLVPPVISSSLEAHSAFINGQFSSSEVFKKNRTYTKMRIAMVVEPDGSVSSYQAIGTGPAEMGTELIRILKQMPKFKPGIRNGLPVRFRIYHPFEFSYQSELKTGE